MTGISQRQLSTIAGILSVLTIVFQLVFTGFSVRGGVVILYLLALILLAVAFFIDNEKILCIALFALLVRAVWLMIIIIQQLIEIDYLFMVVLPIVMRLFSVVAHLLIFIAVLRASGFIGKNGDRAYIMCYVAAGFFIASFLVYSIRAIGFTSYFFNALFSTALLSGVFFIIAKEIKGDAPQPAYNAQVQNRQSAQDKGFSPQAVSAVGEKLERIKKLKDLLDKGIITKEEFLAKKKQIIG